MVIFGAYLGHIREGYYTHKQNPHRVCVNMYVLAWGALPLLARANPLSVLNIKTYMACNMCYSSW